MSFAHPNTEKKHSLTASQPPAKITDLQWSAHQLEQAYDESLPVALREFRRWEFKNPDATTIPSRFSPLFSTWERDFEVKSFRVKDVAQSEQLSRIKRDLEAELPSHSKRRRQELLLADYIEREVQPLGSIEFKRGDVWKREQPADIVSKLRSCRQNATLGLKPSGGFITVYDDKCGFTKLCPDESRHESQRISESYIPAITAFLDHVPRGTFQYVVFSEKNFAPGSLREGKAELMSRFSKLLKTKCMASVAGCVVVQEDPLSVHGDWNVHLNVMLCIDGYFDWKAVRDAWGAHVHFEDEKMLYKKTRDSLVRRGVDISGMGRIDVLGRCFREIAKYAGAPVSSKSEEKKDSGLTKAPPMSEWPPELWREWWIANKGFRRTRSYVALYDPEGYRWDSAKEPQKLSWLRCAGLNSLLFTHLWRKSENSLSKDERAALRAAMNEHEVLDLNDVLWVGSMSFSSGSGYVVHINLIPEDKFVSPTPQNPSISARQPTGPPSG